MPLLPYLDLVLLDYKIGNGSELKKHTGLMTEDVERAAELLEKEKIPVWLRRPMIRGINDSEEELEKLIRFVKKHSGIERIQLLPYHSMGVSKADQMGQKQQEYQKPSDSILGYWVEKSGKESGIPAETL